MRPTRLRSAAVVIEQGHLLVIARRRNGREYAVLPGGGIEPGEDAQDACLRELEEETGLVGTVLEELHLPGGETADERRFHVRTPFAPPRLGGPEVQRSSAENSYRPCWVPLAEVEHIGVVPDSAHRAVDTVRSRPFSR